MKSLLALALSALAFNGFAQKQDTVFLKPRDQDGHSIFIDPDPNSAFYKKIAGTDYAKQDREYKESIKRLNAFKVKTVKPVQIKEIPLNWCKLNLYKGKYYSYAPSDWSYSRASVNDSTLIHKGMERMVFGLIGFDKTGKDTYKVSLINDYNGHKSSINIYIIDPVKGIAVFQYLGIGSAPGGWYELMIDVNKLKQFPVIVNYTPNHKDLEFMFDSPDFAELIKGIE